MCISVGGESQFLDSFRLRLGNAIPENMTAL